MTISKARARKIGQRIQEDLAQLLQREVDDPRLNLVTVTDAEVDRELAYATIYVTAAGAAERQEEILAALEGAQGFLRSRLAAEIDLRVFPHLRFRWDPSPDRAARVDQLLAQLREEREGDGEEGS